MNNKSERTSESIVDQICGQFEEAWQANETPSIGDWLERVPVELRPNLIGELIPLDIDYRLKDEQIVVANEYRHLGEEAVIIAEKFMVANDPDRTLAPHELHQADQTRFLRGAATPESPKTIGPYKLLTKIGEGGMGAVWMAEQETPVKRQVALKLIRPELAPSEFIARFEAERQALSMMNHPNIARVLDAGTSEREEPYFVMELLEGIPFHEYCDNKKLNIKERLELFVPVCNAVQHAHQKGVIHRDIKPSNVLVTSHSGKPIAKVIDFGLAKAVDRAHQLTDKTLTTEIGKVVGTLLYMSPEQAEHGSINVDARSDIYSLGAMLYELLAGSTPLHRQILVENAPLRVLEIIRETDPVRPSDRLSSSSDTISVISEQRKISPARLRQILRGELDWVVMKALEKDRTRRYKTASSLADDIERYLTNGPVLARPPSTVYLVGKFVRRNKGLVGSVAAIILLLLGGIAGTSYGLVQANHRSVEAKLLAKRAKDALQVFTDSFRSVVPVGQDASSDMLAKEVLFRAKESLENSELDAEGKAELLSALTISFFGIGEFNSAVATAEADVAIRKSKLGDDHLDTLKAMRHLADCYLESGQHAKAARLHEDVLKQGKDKLGPEHPLTLNTMLNLAYDYIRLGQPAKALLLNQEATEIRKNKLGAYHPDTINAMYKLAVAYRATGEYDKSLQLNEKVLELKKSTLGPEHSETTYVMHNLASDLLDTGQVDKAIALFEKVTQVYEDKCGLNNVDTLNSLHNLALSYSIADRIEESLQTFHKVVKLRKAKLGSDHPDTLTSLSSLADVYFKSGKVDEALSLLEEVLKSQQTKLGRDHPDTVRTMNSLAVTYRSLGRETEARRLFEEALELRKAKLGLSHPNTLQAMKNLGLCYRAIGETDKMLQLFHDMLEQLRTKLGPYHPRTIVSLQGLAVCYAETGQTGKAISLVQQSLNRGDDRQADHADSALAATQMLFEVCESALGPNNPTTLASMANWGESLINHGAQADAEIVLQRCHRIVQKESPNVRLAYIAQSLLGEAQLGLKKFESAKANLSSGYYGLKSSSRLGKGDLKKAFDRLFNFAEVTNDQEYLKELTAEKEQLDSPGRI